ncbi:hypothetical protein LTR84_009321 [Exophiala bonariae]|uniref:Uncharacterized protein n=1 Tax=Exophiala bonariae TaxID=1690606 RepID=A0AAV9MXK9_9EURO|nr:hypothetical protein LTR84_009321 [Exophiala bonariae]
MSLISVLGFRPSSSSGSSESTHWAILISPHPPSTKPQKSKSRFFHPKITTTEQQSDSALFDMNKHQLRQQQFPIPLKEAPNSTESTTSRSSETPPEAVTVTTLDADTSHPLQLTLKINASILAQTPQRLIPRLSERLYHTPTYGSEDDWLRAALSLMHDILLEPGFDVDQFVEYATSAAKEYTMYEASSEEQQNNEGRQVQRPDMETEDSTVLTLDYRAHMAQSASVKAMLNRDPQQQLTPPESPRLQHVKQQQQQGQGQEQKKPRTWLGFRISMAPTVQSRRPSQRYSFERQDDPYGGLM